MKKFYFLCLFTSIFLVKNGSSQIPFHRGVNVTNWFQTSGPRQIQFTKYTKEDFVNIQSLGCDVIRLPINLHSMTDGEPDYNPDPVFLDFLDSAVFWAEELDLHLILDNHTFDPAENTDPEIGSILVKVWSHMAEHYKNRYNSVYYEILNEPHGISDEAWGSIQQDVIDAIRCIDTKHTIIVGPAGWNGYGNLEFMPEYSDDNLIYTFHFYDPFLFTHQGASWTDPSMAPLEGIPFPYHPDSMPEFPAELEGTWIESSFNNYYQDGTVEKVKELMDIAIAFKNDRNVPVFCGEFGVYIPNSPHQDRIDWYDTVRTYMENNAIAWTIWDYHGGFGIFEEGGNNLFNHDIDTALVRALGFIVPPQTEYEMHPDSSGFPVYLDFIGEQIYESSNVSDGILDFYSGTSPNNGKYCISWSGGSQYTSIGFDFQPNKDMSYLLEQEYALDFMIRGNTPGTAIDVRFIDTKTSDPDDHPWRMRYTIDENLCNWDGKWHHLYLPLSLFTEHGSWDNGWFNPIGEYDWSAADRFEIVAEHHELTGISLWFDNIHITDMDTAIVYDTSQITRMDINACNTRNELLVYPVPSMVSLTISYSISYAGLIKISIYDLYGNKVAELKNKNELPGNYTIEWDHTDLSGKKVNSGVYYCKLSTSQKMILKKLIIL